MKTNKIIKIVALLALAFSLQPSAFADLTATVQPGYVFRSNERPTTSTLNLIGNPTITISGTIGGTNAGLAAKSVNGTQLADSVVDNVTVQYDGSSPRKIQVLTSGLAGPGLTGGTAGGPLTNNVDGVTLMLTNDFIALASNLPPRYIGGTSNTFPMFWNGGWLTNLPASQLYTNLIRQVTFTTTVACSSITAAGTYINTAHGLGQTPAFLRAVLVCGTADKGYAVGDEIDLPGNLRNPVGAYAPFGAPWANSTNVGFAAVGAFTDLNIANKTNGAVAVPTAASWTLKIIARP